MLSNIGFKKMETLYLTTKISNVFEALTNKFERNQIYSNTTTIFGIMWVILEAD